MKYFYLSKLITLKAFNKFRHKGESYKSFLNKLSSQSYDQVNLLDEIYFNPNFKINENSLNKFIENINEENSKFSKTYKELEKNKLIYLFKKLLLLKTKYSF